MEHAEYEKMYHFEDEYWWYKGRREMVLDTVAIIKQKSKGQPLKILDVGCGTGINLESLKQYGDVYGLDFSRNALRLSRSRGDAQLTLGSGDKLPFVNDNFDLVCALDVIEHIDDDFSALKEFYRVLSPKGYLVLTVPAFQFLWSKHDVAAHHKRRYSKSNLIRALTLCGFFVEKSNYWNCILFPVVAASRLLRNDENKEITTDIRELPALMNSTLLRILRIERTITKKNMSFPVGVSILSVCRKDR